MHVTNLEKGSVIVKYTVAYLTAIQITDTEPGRDGQATLSIHHVRFFRKISPAVLALHFNIDDLDQRGDKTASRSTAHVRSAHQVNHARIVSPEVGAGMGSKCLGSTLTTHG